MPDKSKYEKICKKCRKFSVADNSILSNFLDFFYLFLFFILLRAAADLSLCVAQPA
jgi:hypothetical protein